MSTVGELRRAFDASFAAAIDGEAIEHVDLLAISLSGHAHAIRISELASLFADHVITRTPARAPELLGLAGIRGAVVPVFDLAALLGLPGASSPRWIAVAARARIGFGFDAFDGHRRVSPTEIALSNEHGGLEVMHDGDRLRPIVGIDALVARMERKER